ncbi:sporulation membrane protein YtaF [Caldisalinibacter kiritimatiensis]|uniref:Sporulation protein YtaF n=1 Tax=Caldisalinibacter kiritimatiensis TaxID=1304284 RepID=R1AS71_9FIRM|nr:sporulation membrane protein YtaF [Caldisalinibacter kiritimatiensis]EOC99481.1 hypothetical protein L21TH_2486 [Caldisalinibacter kiritimatiensis]
MLQSLLIALVLSIDSFTIGVSYGLKNINIPKLSIVIINLVTIFFLFISMVFGHFVKTLIFKEFASIISCIILVGLGCYFILEGYIKYLIYEKRKKGEDDYNITDVKLNNLGIVIKIAVDASKADMDVSGDIDAKEAIYLGTALSLDSLGVGFASAIGDINYIQVLILAFCFNMLAIIGGLTLGQKFKLFKENKGTYFIPGLLLIIIGLLKLV